MSCTIRHSIGCAAPPDVLRVGIRLRDVLALAVQRPEIAVDRGVEHVRDAQARLNRVQLDPHAPRKLARTASSLTT
jgi:hypothetical protein